MRNKVATARCNVEIMVNKVTITCFYTQSIICNVHTVLMIKFMSQMLYPIVHVKPKYTFFVAQTVEQDFSIVKVMGFESQGMNKLTN